MSAIIEITLPQLAESQVTATIDRWLKQPGDMIDVYEPICEINTDKVTAEIPSTVAGKLTKILVGAGEEVPVGTVICIIETEGETSNDEVASVSTTQTTGTMNTPVAAIQTQGDDSMRNRYSPAVQQLAAQHSIQLANVQGTGVGGRITRKDVLAYVATEASMVLTPVAQQEATSSQVRTGGMH